MNNLVAKHMKHNRAATHRDRRFETRQQRKKLTKDW